MADQREDKDKDRSLQGQVDYQLKAELEPRNSHIKDNKQVDQSTETE